MKSINVPGYGPIIQPPRAKPHRRGYGRGYPIPEQVQERIIANHKDGMSNLEIATVCRISKRSVERALAR
jgi:hypothetical protein